MPVHDAHVEELRRIRAVMTFAEGEIVAEDRDRMDELVDVADGAIEAIHPYTRESNLPNAMGRTPEMLDTIITVFAARLRRQIEDCDRSIPLIGIDRSRENRAIAP